MESQPNQNAQDLLDSIAESGPLHEQYLKEWEDKSPQETVAAAKSAFYGIVKPELVSGDSSLSPDQVAELEAIFGACFSKVEQGSMQRGRRSSSVT